MALAEIPEVLEDIRAGKMVILVDDPDRENEGDLCMAAQMTTAEDINFMATHGRGWICLTLDEDTADRLELPVMVTDNNSRFRTNFTVTIEAKTGVTTGISAADRARTIQVAADPNSEPADLARPGHIQPIRARRGGVLVRTGQTEGSVDLARLAGLHSSGVICEIMNEDGTMSRMPELEVFAKQHGIKICSVRRLHPASVSQQGGSAAPFRPDQGNRHAGGRGGQSPRPGADSGPPPLRMPHRRRVPLAALRLRRAA
jgi:3,4-dihydroxy 2-butanone 4-phosphate synthase/GTP cyclohydrolase II